MFLPHLVVKLSIVGSLRDREIACSASDLHGLNLESCVWRSVSSHHPQEVFLAQFSLYVHKSGLKPNSFHPPFSNIDIKCREERKATLTKSLYSLGFNVLTSKYCLILDKHVSN